VIAATVVVMATVVVDAAVLGDVAEAATVVADGAAAVTATAVVAGAADTNGALNVVAELEGTVEVTAGAVFDDRLAVNRPTISAAAKQATAVSAMSRRVKRPRGGGGGDSARSGAVRISRGDITVDRDGMGGGGGSSRPTSTRAEVGPVGRWLSAGGCDDIETPLLLSIAVRNARRYPGRKYQPFSAKHREERQDFASDANHLRLFSGLRQDTGQSSTVGAR
jgi:hypothetical protein